MPAINIGSHTAWYDEHGRGHLVLLIPGLGSSRLSWWKQIDPLANRYRVIAIDNRDAGDSAVCQAPYSITDLADDAAQVLRAIDATPAFVVGWSMGTFIAQELALRHPALVERLVLVAGSPGGAVHNRPAPEIQALLIRTEAEPVEARVRRTYPLLAAPGHMERYPEDLDEIVRSQQAKAMAFASYQRQLGAIRNWTGAASRLAAITMPALVIHGDVDPLIVCANGRYLAEHMPEARLSTYPDVGHLPPIEAPERFNLELIEFLR